MIKDDTVQPIRTSVSHPLRVDDIVLPETGGRIGMTLCPGKCCKSYYGYIWQRDLDIDMQAVQDWGTSTLVTLMEADELQSCQVGTIGDFCAKIGIEWYHLPIRDVDIPDHQFEQVWSYAGTQLRRSLNRGERVLLHCRGGLGRTGTIAARLLVELGWDSKKAIETVRKSRPGAIETESQEVYAKDCHFMNAHDCEQLSRLMGCLFGGAIGDGLGYLVEFHNIEGIRQSYGQKGVSNPINEERITVSDDTQMTLFTLEGLLRTQSSSLDTIISEVRNAYIDWFGTQRKSADGENIYGRLAFSPSLQVNRAPGNTCLDALAEGGNGRPNEPINDSKGCGSVMRVAPVGLL